MMEINWLTVMAAAAMGFVVGGIWYGPIMGKRWLAATGLTEEDVQQGHMPSIYGGALIFSIIASAMLAHVYAAYGDLELGRKVLIAFGIGAAFVIPAIGTNYLFSQKTRQLFFIDAGYWLLFYTAIGVVQGLLG